MSEKKCSTCLKVKSFIEFHKRTASTDGLTSLCKNCKKQKDKEFRKKNCEKLALYDQKNKEKRNLHLKKRREKVSYDHKL